jgi:lysophospholipase L1-like esterase
MMGADGEGTVDNAHPNDVGMMRKAAVFAKAIEPLLARTEAKPARKISIDDAMLRLAPYVWNRTGKGETARADATMPGAYVKLKFQGSTAVRAIIDGTANVDCPPSAMPVVDYSIDNGEFKSVQLTKTGEVYSLPLADSLDPKAEHRLDLYFRSAALGPNRWQASTVHLRLAGVEIDQGAKLVECPIKSKRAIGFGDSITEGVANEGAGQYYANLMSNNARATWLPLVCTSLDCEYGQLGTGGQGMVRPIEIPPLPSTWDHYDEKTSRLTDGRLTPEPDYIFCAMGTNDYQGDASNFTLLPITDAYTKWLSDVRKACPNAKIFCIVPPLGWHDKHVADAVAARNKDGDRNVFLIDTAPIQSGFGLKGPSQLACDGVHPSVYGNAVLGAFIAAEVLKIISQKQ